MVRPLTRHHSTLFSSIRYREGGFSLLEVLLAILLLGTGFAVLLNVISTGLFAGSVNENEIVAANLAQEITEQIRNTTFASISSQTPAVAVAGFPVFTREVLVSTPTTGLKQITVNVFWNVRDTQTSLSAVSYVSDV